MQCHVSRTLRAALTTVTCTAEERSNSEGEHMISLEEKNYHLCGFSNKAAQ